MKVLICSIGISALLFSGMAFSSEHSSFEFSKIDASKQLNIGEQIGIQACQKKANSAKAEFLTDYNKNVISAKPPVSKLEEVQTKITIGRAMVRINNNFEECVADVKSQLQNTEQYVAL